MCQGRPVMWGGDPGGDNLRGSRTGKHGTVGETLSEEEGEKGDAGTVWASRAPGVKSEAHGSRSGWDNGAGLAEEVELEAGSAGSNTVMSCVAWKGDGVGDPGKPGSMEKKNALGASYGETEARGPGRPVGDWQQQ